MGKPSKACLFRFFLASSCGVVSGMRGLGPAIRQARPELLYNCPLTERRKVGVMILGLMAEILWSAPGKRNLGFSGLPRGEKQEAGGESRVEGDQKMILLLRLLRVFLMAVQA